MTDTGIVKRSVTIAGHRTSISLERPFWEALKEMACSQKLSVNELVRRVDSQRTGMQGTEVPGEGGKNLSSALRVFILERYRTPSAPGAG